MAEKENNGIKNKQLMKEETAGTAERQNNMKRMKMCREKSNQ